MVMAGRGGGRQARRRSGRIVVREPRLPATQPIRAEQAAPTASRKGTMKLDGSKSVITLFLAAAVGGAAGAADLRPVDSFATVGDRAERSRALFAEAGKVIQHPRCLNCHPVGERPTQGTDMHPHSPLVVRGADDKGAIGMRCTTCHQDANFEPSGVPGHPLWHVAPKSMAWQQRIARADLRADQGPAPQRRQDPGADPRAHGARLAGRLGLAAGRHARAGTGHAGTVRRADRRLDRDRRRLPALSPSAASSFGVSNAHLTQRQRPASRSRRRSGHPAALGHSRGPRPHRHEVRLRHRPVRRLHRACRRRAAALLLGAGVGSSPAAR